MTFRYNRSRFSRLVAPEYIIPRIQNLVKFALSGGPK
jgi:hypothetical protein